MSRRILILFAHPSIHLSEVNRVLAKDMTALEGVTLIDLYAEYPTLQIDVVREQQRLLEHDAVVFMFPLYWYSTPAILKEWQDLVLEYGFAYGHDGTALVGKIFTCMLTAGGTEDGYADTGYNHYSLRELLRPLEQTANLCVACATCRRWPCSVPARRAKSIALAPTRKSVRVFCRHCAKIPWTSTLAAS